MYLFNIDAGSRGITQKTISFMALTDWHVAIVKLRMSNDPRQASADRHDMRTFVNFVESDLSKK